MKTLLVKKVTPFAVVVLAVAGAFATTSMQNASKSMAPRIGYTLDAEGACDEPVNCSNVIGAVCQLEGDSGPQAFGKNAQGDCNVALYREP